MSLFELYCKNSSNVRAHGKLRFVLIFGVGLWGISCAVLSTAFFALFFESSTVFRFACVSFVIFPLFGVLLSLDIWKRLGDSNQAA